MPRGPKKVTDFDTFVNSQQPVAEPESVTIDWDKQRDEWLGYLDSLYKDIEQFLKPYIDTQRIIYQYQDIELNEDNIGSYNARRLILKIGRQEVTFTPVGTLLIGSKGRVDVLGSAGRARLILTDRDAVGARSLIRVTVHVGNNPPPTQSPQSAPINIDWVWKIVTSPPSYDFIDLTQETLFNMILEVTNG